MEETKALICTRCGSHHLEKQSETEYKCLSCDAIITKEKAVNFEKEYRKLLEEGKSVDIANLRYLVKKTLEGHIDKDSLIKYSQDILRILPEDILSLFYIKYINREKNPFEYESFLKRINNEATQTEVDEIIDIIINNARFREKDEIINIINKFYKGREDKLTELEKALKQRTKEIDLFSDIPRDIFICHSSLDKDKVNEILKMLEEDGNTCWISSRNIPWDSDNYWLNIEKAIKSCNIFLCLNSINTMQSNDCRREVEIASSLNKKRIEYKLDDARDITLFKNFFTGQWITNINDLLDKVYDLKHKETKLKEEAKKLLESKEYEKAKEVFLDVNDDEAKKYIVLCNTLISSTKLMENSMYEEAKAKLLQIDDIIYTKDLLEECSHKISLNSTINYEVNNNIKEETTTREETNKNDILKKAKFLLNQTKDYQEAEKILFEEIAYNENNFELWYYYLYAITKGLKDNNHKNINLAFENLKKLVPNERKKDIQDLDNRLNPVTIKRLEEEKERKIEEEREKVQKEYDAKIEKEQEKLNIIKLKVKQIDEETDNKINNHHKILMNAIDEFKKKNIISKTSKTDFIYFGSYPQTLKNANVKIIGKETDERGYYSGSDGSKYQLVNKGLFKKFYYKVEPIRWLIVKHDKESMFVISDMIIDNHIYDNYTYNYEESEIRSWLNKEFYNKAFTDKEKKIIQTTLVDNSLTSTCEISNQYICNDTIDKVFLLSTEEVTSSAYGFSKNKLSCKKVTDYAKELGATEIMGQGNYYLRSSKKYKDTYNVCMVTSDKSLSATLINSSFVGTVPAMLLSLSLDTNVCKERCVKELNSDKELEALREEKNKLFKNQTLVKDMITKLEAKKKETLLKYTYTNTSSVRSQDDDKELVTTLKNDTISFGLYPQTIKDKNVTITTTFPDNNGYYLGSDGEYYAKLIANPHIKNEKYYYSNNEEIISGKEYYFKVEPIIFNKIHGKNKDFYLSSKIIETMAYQDIYYQDGNKYYVKTGVAANNYEYSKARKVLNNDFLYKAFTQTQRDLLEKTYVDNSAESTGESENIHACPSTYDYVFLPSIEEMTLRSNGFKAKNEEDKNRVKETTDYAKANGAYLRSGYQNYFLRSPDSWLTSFVKTVTNNGKIIGNDFSYPHNGICVGIVLKQSK